MSRCLLLLMVVLGVAQGVYAQQQHIYVSGGDTLRYTYTPIVGGDSLESPSTVRTKPSFLTRLVDYYTDANRDRTFEKKIDFTFAGGVGYSKNTSLSLAVMALGQYRVDRTDSLTQPSYLSIFGNVSITGFYALGVDGVTFLEKDKHRVDYMVAFSSSPRSMWGVGYDAGRSAPEVEYVEKMYHVKGRYLRRILPRTYMGVLVDFRHTDGRKFDDASVLGGEKQKYTTTGIGLCLEYDSRDLRTAPERGIYLSFQETMFPDGLSSYDGWLWRSEVIADFYKRVWRGGVVALDMHGEFNSQSTPWTLLARMGGSYRMRGYYEGRYADENLITCQLELRQRIWKRIGGVVWGGAGNVFPSFADFDFKKTLPNYGLGLRFELKRGMNIRMDYGFGKNTSGFLLNINEAF